MTRPNSVGFLDRSVPSGTHVCAFVSGPEQRDEVVLPFLADGIRAGQKCICILESLDPPDVLARLGRQVDVAEPVQTGQLQLGTPADAYLASGRFDTEEMLSYWEQAAAQSPGTYRLTRAAGEMPSVLNNPDGRAEFFRYEARLTGLVARLPEVVLCLYDLQRFGAEVLMDALRTHPMVAVDGMTHDNPYFIDPGEFLRRTGTGSGSPARP